MNRFLFCAALTALVIALSILFQKPITYNNGLGWDGSQYAELTAQCWREPLNAREPFAYRIGAPCLAALVPLAPRLGLWTVNVAASVLLLFLVDAWVRRHVSSTIAPWLLAGFAFHWVAPLRQVWWYPTYIDPGALCAMVGALLMAHRRIPFALICFGGSLIRETTLIVPLALMFGARVRQRDSRSPTSAGSASTDFINATLGLVTSLAGIGLTHLIATPSSDYWFADAAFYWAYSKPLPTYLLAIFIAFGPAVSLLAVGWGAVKTHLSQFPDHAVMLVSAVILAGIGGSDTERFLMWSSPIVLVLIGKAAETVDWSGAKAAAALLFTGQIVSGRWLLTIPPDFVEAPPRAWPILTPWSAESYLQLFSQTPDRLMSAVALAQYVAVSFVLVVAFAWQRRSRSTALA
ncbi:MAG: hypothetical protein ACRD2N_02840 [Vicinamibacterales bacterium]